MSDQFSVDLDHLDEVTVKLRSFKEVVGDLLAELDRRVAAVGPAWSGTAYDAYVEAHREWLAGATDVREGLGVLEDAARTAHGAYTDAKDANLRMLGG
ncbi:WXG100 family type VII secretion target [Antrihabitans cavernicola]|uniref:ESAT-6-like protein n=1 Tax=Antrihabitans cavernicola TaxID=2495913 RepID=A0A5A7S3X6_9NOCA|nr:WXG100 family type VII secretion target [Spelaeibacter cavernicola]KAA0018529.1 WXG100 family type VII secretion target [Spelaeibacter cavernicola]